MIWTFHTSNHFNNQIFCKPNQILFTTYKTITSYLCSFHPLFILRPFSRFLLTSEQLVWCLVVIFCWGRITSSCLSSATWHYLMFHTDTYKNGKIDIFHVPYLFFAVLSFISFKYLSVPKNQYRQYYKKVEGVEVSLGFHVPLLSLLPITP